MSEKVFYLTFDGAPDPPFTCRLLEVLEKHGVKATFFMEGHRVDAEPECARAVLAAGHSLGNHTYHHIVFDGLSFDEAVKEIEDCDRAILEHLGVKSKLVRPPYGTITPEFSQYLEENNRQVVLWSMSVRDWEGPDAPSIARRLLDQVHDQPEITVVLHDYLDLNAQVLEIILPELKRRGYTFQTYQM